MITIGRVVSVDGPRTDVADIITYTYNTCTTGQGAANWPVKPMRWAKP